MATESELQELRDLVAQLRADNSLLRQEQRDSQPGGSSNVSSEVSHPSTLAPPSGGANAIAPERLVFVPRDRKCPYFNGRSGANINEWVEEAQACMRARYLSAIDQAFFLFDHLEGEAREEIKYRPAAEREDPNKIIGILKDLYGCSQSYVALQEAFFCRKQQDGETLQEFSLALMSLMERVKQRAPAGMSNAGVLLRDQFTEHVLDSSLRRELKQLVRRCPTSTLLEVREEAIRWEREGMPGGARGRSYSVPSAHGIQYAVHSGARPPGGNSFQRSELSELKDILKQQQEQLNQLTQTVALLHNTQHSSQSSRPPRGGSVICRRCQRPGHYARECEAPRPHPQPPPATFPSSSGGRPSYPRAPAEN